MRKIIFLSLLLVLACAVSASASTVLFRGAESLGTVQTVETSAGSFVSIEQVGQILGFESKRIGEELYLTRGNTQFRLILNSAAAWRGFSIVPLYSAPFEQGGRVWVDSASAVSLFQSFAGRGANNKLRFASASEPPVVASAPQPQPQGMTTREVDARLAEMASAPQPEPEPEIASTPQLPAPATRTFTASSLQPEPEIVSTPQPPAVPATPEPRIAAASSQLMTQSDVDARLAEIAAESQSEPQIDTPDTPAEPETIELPETTTPELSQVQSQAMTAEEIDARLKKLSEQSASSQDRPARRKPKTETPKPAKKGKPQPKRQTFTPEDSKADKSESYSGIVQVIRWTYQDDPHRRVRAVIETDDDGDPQVFVADGKLHALLANVLENAEGLESQYADLVKTELNRSTKGVDYVFTPEGFIRAEKLVLNDPRRIVLDFFFPDLASNDTAPEEEIQAQPADSEPRVPDIVITPEPRRQSPAVKTPPSSITIPTNVGPGTAGRKTIVVDPGHGGKDPGASDNGVIEKNVNLAVGLALERVLTSRGYNVVMTRKTDVYLKLQERTDIANNVNADLFVSVHVNALPSKKSMTGFEIYIMALPTDKDAMELAKAENREYVEGKGMDTENVDRRTEMLLRILGDMQQNIKISESTDFAAALYNAGVLNGLPMKRVAQAPFFVLRGAGMPAVLLEIGFLTNAIEAQLLTRPDYHEKIAQAMAAGIANYLR